MRTLNEIIVDLKDGKKVEYEEARLGLLAVNGLLFFAEQDIKHLLSDNKLIRDIVRADYQDVAFGRSKRHIKALEMSPEDFLGSNHPDRPEARRIREVSNKLLENMKKQLKEQKETE